MSIRVLCLGLALTACSSKRDDKPAPAPAVVTPPADAAISSSTRPEAYTESNVLPERRPRQAEAPDAFACNTSWIDVKAKDGCWFFSGPSGRDTKLAGRARLTVDGDYVKLYWNGATFEGSVQAAGELSLARRATHHFGGAWTVDETIVGTLVGTSLSGQYHYEECSRTKCPSECTIDAHVQIDKAP